jgi:hypothetical protein
MTLTKGEYDAARRDTPAVNGTAPAAKTVTKNVTVSSARTCEVCGTSLRPTQKRVCSPRCAARLGGAVAKAKASQRGSSGPGTSRSRREHRVHESQVRDDDVPADGLLALIATLPDEVVALELVGGWRCIRT